MGIQQENEYLRAELGTNPLYAWKNTRDLFMIVQKVENGQPKYDYKANAATGLIELHPVMIKMPMLPRLKNNWVLARWVESNQESCVKQLCGVKVMIPPDGIWQPIEMTALAEGFRPERMDSELCVFGVRGQRLAVQEFFDKAEEREDKARAADTQKFVDACRDRFTVGMQVPGTKGSVSLFSAKPDEPVERVS